MTEVKCYKPSLARSISLSIPVSKQLSLQLPIEEKQITYPDNYNDIQTLLDLSSFSNNNIISIGLRVFHPGSEEEDCHDKYYLYQKVRKHELTTDNLKILQKLDHNNGNMKHIFNLKIFNESFLDKYTLISCVKEQYNNCQYKLYKVLYSS